MTEIKNWLCPNEEDTKKLAGRIARLAQKGDIFALYGTLGMGKSVFARAFILELTTAPEVPSPTFTLVQEYEAPDFAIFHYDLYRLKSPEEIFELGMEDAMHNGVCLIEWPERMEMYLPRRAFRITIEPAAGGRRIMMDSRDCSQQARLREW